MQASKQSTLDHLHLHFIVLIFGFTAILGKLISLNATELVFYRMFLAMLGVFAYAQYKGISMRLPWKSVLMIFGIGAIVALHWITFFGAVKVSNVAVTLGCMASATLFTAFIEPFFVKKRISWVEVIIGLVIIVGLYIITQFALNYWLGIVYALISAFLAALFGVFNMVLVRQKYNAVLISLYEMMAGCILIGIYVLCTTGFSSSPLDLKMMDVIYLLILAWVCTTYAFVAMVYLLKRLSAYTVALVINMEPVYGIILAFLIFGKSEQMHLGFYIGALVILGSILIYPFLKSKEEA